MVEVKTLAMLEIKNLQVRVDDRAILNGLDLTVNADKPFFRMSGTSMAAAVTSGVAALVIEASRASFGSTPTPETVRAILAYSALPLAGADPLTQGHGEVNASGAVALAATVSPQAVASTWPTAGLPAPFTTIDGQAWEWSQSIVWGNSIV